MGFLNKKSKKVINMYVTVSSKRKDAMRKYFLLLTLCGLSTSVYAMRMREGEVERMYRETDFIEDLQMVSGIEDLEHIRVREAPFKQIGGLRGNYDPTGKKLLYAMLKKWKTYDSKLQNMDNKLKRSEKKYAELQNKLESISEMNKLCEVVQELGDARRTLYDKLMYGAGGAIMGLFLVYSVSKI
ncbi:MAG: hypothetical protein ACTSR2_08880 [Candidatus Hodarchaeales archaeon]